MQPIAFLQFPDDFPVFTFNMHYCFVQIGVKNFSISLIGIVPELQESFSIYVPQSDTVHPIHFCQFGGERIDSPFKIVQHGQ